MMSIRRGLAACCALLLLTAAGCGAMEDSAQTARVSPPVTVAQARAEGTRVYRTPAVSATTAPETTAPVTTAPPVQTTAPARITTTCTTTAPPAEITDLPVQETTVPPPAKTAPPSTARREPVRTTAVPETKPAPATSPATKPAPAPETTPETKPTVSAPAYATEILALVNQARAEYGLPALKLNQELLRAANIRVGEIAQSFSHTRPDGTPCFTVLEDCELSFLTAGENIAQGYATAQEVMAGWMQSEGHRVNILNGGFSMLGVGYDAATDSWVQIFAG